MTVRVALVLATLALSALSACGNTYSACPGPDCSCTGSNCACRDGASCASSCGSSCNLDCGVGGRCEFSCNESCNIECGGSESCLVTTAQSSNVTCERGRCDVTVGASSNVRCNDGGELRRGVYELLQPRLFGRGVVHAALQRGGGPVGQRRRSVQLSEPAALTAGLSRRSPGPRRRSLSAGRRARSR
jgi:hypothetical protein